MTEIENVSGKTESISIKTGGVDKLLTNKKFQFWATIVLFLIILVSATSIRLSGMPNLIDQTTGKYVFADPDAFYEYRVAETIANGGDISGIDPMRSPGLDLPYTQEMQPKLIAFAYKLLYPLNDKWTLDYIDAAYPAIAFAFSLIFFFLLCWYLTKSKVAALLASLMLAYSPVYLQRTAVGVSSHEALGMVFFFLALLVYAFSVENYKRSWKWTLGLGVATGISLSLSLFSWAGASNFVLMIFSFFMLVYYLFGIREEEMEIKKRFFAFSLVWILVSIFFMPLTGNPLSSMLGRVLSNYGLLAPFSIFLMAFDMGLEKYSQRIAYGRSKYRVLYALAGTIIFGAVVLFIFLGKSPWSLISGIYSQLIRPLGGDRVALTVAYFAQPYLTDLTNSVSKAIFWLFLGGLLFIGIEFGQGINSRKHRFIFYGIWVLCLLGMLFSRFASSSSILNGTSVISKLFYVLSFLVLGAYLLWLHINHKFVASSGIILLLSWMMIMIMSIRSAIRTMFVIATFVFVIASFFTVKSHEYGRRSREELTKYGLYLISGLSLLVILFSFFGNPITGSSGAYDDLSYTIQYSGALTNSQWQNAMSWTRNETAEDAIFLHWWDYGYLVQTLGNRATVVDGGNANVYWNHLIGRYVLTTPEPETALSFMKTHNVSYLLIDPTDFGKYPAYSSIGSDETGDDRFSQIPIMAVDYSQIVENAGKESRVYGGNVAPSDEDIVYTTNGSEVFLPQGRALVIAVVVEITKGETSSTFNQPRAVYAYNGQQIILPLRYLYYNGQIIDFGSGVEGIARMVSAFSINAEGGVTSDPLGTVIYLSPKVADGLFAQLYLLDDVFNRYPTLTVANLQPDPFISQLRAQGVNVEDVAFFQGLRGPLKIWKVEYSPNVAVRDEFLSRSGGYGEFDGLDFTN